MADGSKEKRKDQNTAQSLKRLRRDIREVQVERLRATWGAKGKAKIDLLLREQRQENDLLSVLIRRMPRKSPGPDAIGLEHVIRRMRSALFSAEDLFVEAACLEDAVEDVLEGSEEPVRAQTRGAVREAKTRLRTLVGAVLRETSGVCEQIVKIGQRGFCLLDAGGKIVSTNPQMDRLLGTASAQGRALKSFLDSEGRSIVGKVLKGKAAGKPRLLRMELMGEKGGVKTVGVEVAPMTMSPGRQGGYFCAVDLTQPVRMETELFNNFPWGVARLRLNGDFIYMNPAALKTMGLKSCRGLNVRGILPDAKNRRTVIDSLRRRRAGLSDEYPVELQRPADRRRVPVMIAAMPERDLHGRVVGSLAIIRDQTVEQAAERIHTYITSSAEAARKIESRNMNAGEAISENLMLNSQTTLMLAATVMEVQDILPFDLFIITRFSESMTHLRKFFFLYPGGRIHSYVRWWMISDPLRERYRQMTRIVRSSKPDVVGDYEDFLNQPQNRVLRDLPEYRWVLQEGFKSAMNQFVVHEGKLLASIALLSKKKMAYGENHVRIFSSLPLEKVVLVAIQSEEKAAETFRLKLLREIVETCESVGQVAKVVVEGLGKGHLWDHIALYMIDEKRREFRLLHQRNLGKATPLREPFRQPLTVGILGRVYKTGRHVLIQDKPNDPEFRDVYLASVPGMVSELCLPIVIGGKTRWLLNIEDANQNAFSAEEVGELSALLGEVCSVLDRIWVRHFLLTTLNRASDLVFMTNPQGFLEYPNLEALRQLEYTEEEMSKTRLEEVIAGAEDAEAVYSSPSVRSREVRLRRRDGSTFPALLSASTLPEELGGRVMICKDITIFKRVEELEYLKKMYHEISVQTQTPLSLAFGWLQSLKARSGDRTLTDTLEKALRQLRKVEITYDRLALYDQEKGILPYNEVLFGMPEIVDHLRATFPVPETDKMVFHLHPPLPYLKGDLFQLNFCFESILSFLLRHLPPEEKIHMDVSCAKRWVLTQVRGFLPKAAAEAPRADQASDGVSRTLAQMALSSNVIEQFLRNHNGSIAVRPGKGYARIFDIRLPAAGEEALT
jgi:PAS domain S-box-containing protein